MKVKYISQNPNFGDFSTADLTLGKVYSALSTENGFYRIIDDIGEDYLYPKELFELIEE